MTEARRGAMAFALAHAMHQAGQLWGRHQPVAGSSPWPLASLHLLAAAASWRWPRAGFGALAALGAWQCWATFPRTANHLFLGVAVSLLFACLDASRDDDAVELRRLGLVLVAAVFAWSGVQKLMHGYWFSGQLLAWAATSRSDFALALRPWLDDVTAAQLAGLSRTVAGSGPFALAGGWAALSNAVWVAELAAPLALCWRRGGWAVLLGAAWALQVVAHEWEFALLLSNLLAFCAPPRVRPALLAAGATLVAALALVRLGMLPFPPGLLPSVAEASS